MAYAMGLGLVIDYGLVWRGVACNSRGFAKASQIISYRAPGRCEQRPSNGLKNFRKQFLHRGTRNYEFC
jgi:hypothetical protein